MHRFIASQYVFCSPFQILKRMAVELDEEHTVCQLFSLDAGNVESAQTLFFDGVLSIGILSITKNNPSANLIQLAENYNYINVTTLQPNRQIQATDKPLLLDFGSENTAEINQILPLLTSALVDFSVFDIIAACTYYPALFLVTSSTLAVNYKSKILLWENIDLITKKTTRHTRIRQF